MQKIISGAQIPTPRLYQFEDDSILAYIVNMGMLGEGILKGEWAEFPTTPEKIDSVLKEIGIDGGRYKNHFIAEYITNIDGLEDRLPPSPNLNELNLLAHIISAMELEDMDVFEAALALSEFDEVSDFINLSFNLDCYEYIPDVEDDVELGLYCVQNFDFPYVSDMEDFLMYVDHESYGRNKRESERSEFVENGYITVVDLMDIIYESSADVPQEYRIV